jgi:hypothetical protein
MSHKKTDFNKRLLSNSDIKKRRKRGEGFLINSFKVEEVFDESGETLDDTVIKFSFEGLLVYMTIAKALKFNKELSDILNLKR